MAWWAHREELVAKSLRGRGAQCDVNTKTVGATDVLAWWPKTGTTWRVQVKSTKMRDKEPAWPTPEEMRRIKMTATKNGETPVVAHVYRDCSIYFFSARTGKRIRPTDTRDI